MDGRAKGIDDDVGMTVMTTRYHNLVIVTVSGDVDMSTADRLREAVNAALDRPTDGPVIVDLRDVQFLSSSGLRVLLNAHEHAVDRREPLRLVVDHTRPVIRPLQISGMDRVLALYEDLAEAARSS